MSTAYVVVTLVTALVNGAAVVADAVRARFVLANSAAVGVPVRWLPALGALKGAGAVGLVVGLLGVGWIGVAAAVGLVAFFVCAVAVHVRARAFTRIAFPGGYLALAVASLVLVLAR